MSAAPKQPTAFPLTHLHARGVFTTSEMARVALIVGALAAPLIILGGARVLRFRGVRN